MEIRHAYRKHGLLDVRCSDLRLRGCMASVWSWSMSTQSGMQISEWSIGNTFRVVCAESWSGAFVYIIPVDSSQSDRRARESPRTRVMWYRRYYWIHCKVSGGSQAPANRNTCAHHCIWTVSCKNSPTGDRDWQPGPHIEKE